MNKDGHVVNAALLGVGVGVLVQVMNNPGWTLVLDQFLLDVLEVATPIVLGALFPDVDTAFGKHRKTLHNLPVLAFFMAFPLVFGNLEYVWLGILTHYVLDIVGSRRGIALFYPFPKEYGFPTGVTTSSDAAMPVTIVITILELAFIALILHFEFSLATLELAAQTAAEFVTTLAILPI